MTPPKMLNFVTFNIIYFLQLLGKSNDDSTLWTSLFKL